MDFCDLNSDLTLIVEVLHSVDIELISGFFIF